VLVVAEVAMALLLLVGAGLMIRSFLRLQQVDPGFDSENVLTLRVNLPIAKYDQEDKFRNFYQQLLTRVKALPGVRHAEATSSVPLSGQRSVVVFEIVGRPPAAAGDFLSADNRIVTSGYFTAMGIPLVKGRFFTDRDTKDSPPVVIINETLARSYFPNEDPLGKRLLFGETASEIVGVVKEVRQISLDAEAKREIFEPFMQFPPPAMSLIVKTTSPPKNLVPAVRNEVLALDKDQPIFNVKTMDDILSASVATPRLYMILLSTFGLLALILAAAGIYGVLAYSVTQRTHEIGIRIALGAQTRDVLRLVVAQGMLLVGIGLAIGLVAALIITRLLSSILFGISALDITTFAGVSIVLAVVGVLACVIPARRATKISPIIALRYD
jgi:putative ABC transport system permease protein